MSDREAEAYLAEHNDLKGLYDDDRAIRVESGINGELSITLGGQSPIFVFAEDFQRLVDEQAEMSIEALPVHRRVAAREAERDTKHERAMSEVTDERDRAEEWADKLAAAIAPESVIGEHSNANNPWANAIDHLAERDDTLRQLQAEVETAHRQVDRSIRRVRELEGGHPGVTEAEQLRADLEEARATITAMHGAIQEAVPLLRGEAELASRAGQAQRLEDIADALAEEL